MPNSFVDCWYSVMDKTVPDDSKVRSRTRILPHPVFTFLLKITN